MSYETTPDYYSVLQVSPHAEGDTIERVFRLLAKRFHPDNGESGDADRFGQVVEAFRVLSDPEKRAEYDARYQEIQQVRWKVFDQESARDDVAADRQLRGAILSVLYSARRNDVDRPGVGIVDLEQLLGTPEAHMKFHLWYLREHGWLQRLDNGTLAITADGVDRVMEMGGPDAPHLLGPGSPLSPEESGSEGEASDPAAGEAPRPAPGQGHGGWGAS
jgi:curved DNA-binding protein CbpA